MYNHNNRNNNSYSFIVIIVIIQTLITESSWNVFMISGFHQTILTVFIDTQFNNEDMQEILFILEFPFLIYQFIVFESQDFLRNT